MLNAFLQCTVPRMCLEACFTFVRNRPRKINAFDSLSRSSKQCRYKRYRLSDGKDFTSLFFPEKESLLKLLQHFECKSGEQRR